MLKTGLVLILFLVMGKCYSQENHFILIQSENNQPFFATLGGQVFSSTSSGHLLLARLRDSVYPVSIGFPGGAYPEQLYSIRVEKDDLHLELKFSDNRQWSLFDPQSGETKTPLPRNGGERALAPTGIKKDDAFSRLMAGVVNDTAVMYADFIAEQPAAAEKPGGQPIGMPAGKPSGKLEKPAESRPVKNPSVENKPVENKPVETSPVEKAVGKTTEEPVENPPAEVITALPAGKDRKDTVFAADSGLAKGFGITLDSGIKKESGIKTAAPLTGKKAPGPARDSAIVVINTLVKDTAAGVARPAAKATLPEKRLYIEKISEKKTAHQVRILYVDHGKTGKGDTVVIRIPLDTVAVVAKNGSSKSKSPDPNLPASHRVPKDSASVPLSTDPGTAVGPDAGPLLKKPVIVNSDCTNFASNGDIERLRTKMMTAVSDKDRVDQAARFFRTRCVTTGQIRTLNRLFMNDEGSFQFFKAAYPFVTDSDQFKSLVNLFTDPLVISKFKKLTGQL